MNKILNLQDVFLNQARKDKIPVTIYLIFFIIQMNNNAQQNLVYKHAISTICPVKPIPILDGSEKAEQ